MNVVSTVRIPLKYFKKYEFILLNELYYFISQQHN